MNRPSISAIEQAVCAHMKVTPEELRGQSRQRRFARPRQVAMTLYVEMAGKSLPYVGKHFGRDHTTVLHAQRRIAEIVAEKLHFARLVDTIRASVRPTEWHGRHRMELEACRAIAEGIRGAIKFWTPIPLDTSLAGLTYWDLHRRPGVR